MKIVVAPNAFKGSFTATKAAAAMSEGIRRVLPTAEIIEVPVADGGDGLVDVTLEALNGETSEVQVTGPDFKPVNAALCFVPDLNLAAIEMALASGLALLPEAKKDPTRTTTLGTGELIAHALDQGVQRILIGIGGSATNDGGIGMAAALGVRFTDKHGDPIRPVGGSLHDIEHIDHSAIDPRIKNIKFDVACDVDNLLTGHEGAAHVYGPQKGATPTQVQQLDDGLAHLARCIEKDLGIDVTRLPGGGAAGGLGAGLHAFLGAELRKGVDLILDLVDLETKLHGADLVLTGEGQIDFQTVFGKAPAGVAAAAKKQNIPCFALAGSVGEGLEQLHQTGIDAVFSLCNGPISLKQAMENGDYLLTLTTEQVLRSFLAGSSYRTNT